MSFNLSLSNSQGVLVCTIAMHDVVHRIHKGNARVNAHEYVSCTGLRVSGPRRLGVEEGLWNGRGRARSAMKGRL